MIIAGLDTETTGLEPGDHRIIEIYIGLWDLATQKRLFAYEQRIDPQRAILADAQRVHGISNSDLVGKPIWDTVAPNIVKILAKAHVIVAHNGESFDMPFINHELQRLGHPAVRLPLVDTVQSRWASPIGKSPTLQELCFACDVTYDPEKAHAAAYDVEVMVECFFRGHRWGRFTLPNQLGVAA